MTNGKPDELSEYTRRQTTKNLALLGDYLREILDNPAQLEEIPSGSTIVFLPEDDPAHARGNLALATKAARAGKDVWIYRTGPRGTDEPAQRAIHVDALELARLGREVAEHGEADDDVETHYGVG